MNRFLILESGEVFFSNFSLSCSLMDYLVLIYCSEHLSFSFEAYKLYQRLSTKTDYQQLASATVYHKKMYHCS